LYHCKLAIHCLQLKEPVDNALKHDLSKRQVYKLMLEEIAHWLIVSQYMDHRTKGNHVNWQLKLVLEGRGSYWQLEFGWGVRQQAIDFHHTNDGFFFHHCFHFFATFFHFFTTHPSFLPHPPLCSPLIFIPICILYFEATQPIKQHQSCVVLLQSRDWHRGKKSGEKSWGVVKK
jgi:hypothetical protein